MRGKYKLNKDERLKPKEIRALVKKGQRYFSKNYLFIYQVNGNCKARFAVSVSKKVGNAPTRNYHKRCVREIFRQNKQYFQNLDTFIFKKQSDALSYQQRQNEIIKSMLRLQKNSSLSG